MSIQTVNVFAPTHPHKKQIEVLKTIDEGQRFVLLRCGRKWRKTSLIVSWLNEKALLCDKGLSYPLILPFQEQARATVWKDHVKRLMYEMSQKGFPYKQNETTLTLTYPNGGRFTLLGANNEVALRSASDWGAIGIDEFDDWKPDVWDVTIRPNLMTHKAPAIIGGTPKGKKNIYRFSKNPRFKEFHFTSFDNPDLDPNELNELIEDAKEKGDDFYRQEIMAEFISPQGMVYKEFPETNYGMHPYNPSSPVHIAFDWGINDPTAIIWIQPTDKSYSSLRVIDYYQNRDANLSHFADVIVSKPYKEAEIYVGDASGNQRNLVTGRSIINELQDLLDERYKHSSPTTIIYYQNNLRLLEQIRTTHKYIPNTYIDSERAEYFYTCLINYQYPKERTGINQSNEVPIHDEYSHAMRAFEYYCNYIDEFLKPRPITVQSEPAVMTGDWLINNILNKSDYDD